MNKDANILKTIVEHKYSEVANFKKNQPIEELQEQIANLPPTKGFYRALQTKASQQQTAIVAEIKKASPSRGVLCQNFDPSAIALCYEQHGATCLSVLTDSEFFMGAERDLKVVGALSKLPILRKDFIVDPYQVYATRAMGADCLLLIVACLTDAELLELTVLARSLSLDVLIEVHDSLELERALKLNLPMVGINNRNLQTFECSLETSRTLKDKVGKCLVVSESGIFSRADIESLQQTGIYCFLIGESLITDKNPAQALQALLSKDV